MISPRSFLCRYVFATLLIVCCFSVDVPPAFGASVDDCDANAALLTIAPVDKGDGHVGVRLPNNTILFRDVPTSTTVEKIITIMSEDDCPASITSICLGPAFKPGDTCTHNGNFDLLDLPIGQTVRRGEPKSFRIRFTASIFLGDFTTGLLIDVTLSSRFFTFFEVDLIGNVVKRTPKVSCPDPNLGLVRTGVAVELPVTITNSGSADLTLDTVALSGDTPSNFKITTPFFPNAIGPFGGTSTGVITFLTLSPGTFKGNLVFTTNAPDSPTVCAFQVTAANMAPTLSEWGQMIMALLMLTAAVFFILQRRIPIADANAGVQFSLNQRARVFDAGIFIKVLACALAFTGAGLAAANWLIGSISVTDVCGSLICAVILAYLIHLCIVAAKEPPTNLR